MMPERRYPIGAEAAAWRRCELSRVGAAAQAGRGGIRHGERALRWNATPADISRALRRMRGHGARYRFRLDGGDAFPDPASRFQPEGPHGPSQVVDPTRFRWTDAAWQGADIRRPGHLRNAHRHIHARRHLGGRAARVAGARGLGITIVELMPVSDSPASSAGATTASDCSRRPPSTARRTISAASWTTRTASASA